MEVNSDINLTKARAEFKKYVSGFDMNNSMISRKYSHSLSVADTSRKIAEYVKQNVDDSLNVDLAEMIGLLHDIGRFEQAKVYNTFKDSMSCDHALLGVQILKSEDFIYNFLPQERYHETLFVAIYYHNKFKLPDGYDGTNMKQARIIRDSDKLDILRLATQRDFNDLYGINDIRDQYISEATFSQFMSGTQCLRTNLKNEMDDWVNMISFIFDMYYPKTFEILREEGYIDKLLTRIDTAHNHSKIETMREAANQYIDLRLGKRKY